MMTPQNLQPQIDEIIAAAEQKNSKEVLSQYSSGTLNIKNRNGETPLLIALRENKAEAAAALLEVCADATAVDKRSDTALHWAALVGLTTLIPTLIARGAKLEARNDQEQTPLLSALDFGKAEAAVALLEAGADATAVDDCSKTVLHLAAEAGFSTLIPTLIAKEVNLEARNEQGKTPLLSALDFGKTEAAVALLEAGADATCVDFLGKTGLNRVPYPNTITIIPSLIAKGAKLDEYLKSLGNQDSFKDMDKLLLMFKTVQSCFNPELSQRLANYMEILLLENHQSLLTIESKKLLEFIQNNFNKIADIFFQNLNSLLEEAQKVLKERKIDMDIAAIRGLLTETLVGHITALLSPHKTAAIWYSCINFLLCESNDVQPVFTNDALTTMPKSILKLIQSYVWGESFQKSQESTLVNPELFKTMETALKFQASDVSLNRNLFEQRLQACCEYLSGRQRNLTPELPPDKVLYFYGSAPGTRAPKLSFCVAEQCTSVTPATSTDKKDGAEQRQASINSSPLTQSLETQSSICVASNSPLFEQFKQAQEKAKVERTKKEVARKPKKRINNHAEKGYLM